jgi:aconitate hydratase
MGVLPLQFAEGASPSDLGLTGEERFDIEIPDDLAPRQALRVTATPDGGEPIRFDAVARVDTPVEVDYYRNGGILHTVLRRLAG